MCLLISGKFTSPNFGAGSIFPVWFSVISSLVIKITISQSKEKNQAARFVLEKRNSEFSHPFFNHKMKILCYIKYAHSVINLILDI